MSLLLYSLLEIIITTVCGASARDLFHQPVSEVQFKPDFTKLQNISWKALVYSTVKARSKQRHLDLLNMRQALSSPETSWKPSQSFPGGTYHSSAVSAPFLLPSRPRAVRAFNTRWQPCSTGQQSCAIFNNLQ